MNRLMIAALMGAVSLSSMAYAQTTGPSTTTNPPAATTSPPPATSTAPGARTDDSMRSSTTTTSSSTVSGAASSGQVTYYNQTGEDYRVSRIIGTNVRNNQNENIGEVEDLIVDRKGDIKAAIISVGGFLGIGERWIAVNFDSLNMQQDGNNWRVMLNTTKDQMKTAPEFKYESSWSSRRSDTGASTATTPTRSTTTTTTTERPSAPANPPGTAPVSPPNR
ncbi:MAG: hypothetical protein JWN93_2511 [Hyphomicrobiales bacterium]|nr:hypothetical protein [Hyphomicrobiales bacterium]